jgi:hypothetical protein
VLGLFVDALLHDHAAFEEGIEIGDDAAGGEENAID